MRKLKRENYKVIELTKNNGEKFYKVKFKHWYGWRYLNYQPGMDTYWDYEFKDIENACEHIDWEIESEEERIGRKVKKCKGSIL